MCGIYKITNLINGQIYIGQSINIKSRWRKERSNAFLEGSPDYDSSRSEAFRVFGLENFFFEIIEECPKEKLNEREKYWIAYYNSYYNGYNDTKGGAGSASDISLNDEQVKMIRDQLLNTIKTNIEIAKEFNVSENTVCGINTGYYRHESNIDYPIRKPKTKKKAYCKKCGIELKDSDSKLCLNCYALSLRKVERPTAEELKQLLLDANGNFTAIGKQFGITDNAIRKWCKAYDMPFHTNDYKTQKPKRIPQPVEPCKPVAKLDIKTGEVLEIYPSIYQAEQANGNTKHISQVCRGKRKTCQGFGWKFIEE